MARGKRRRRKGRKSNDTAVKEMRQKHALDRTKKKGTARAISRRRSDVWEMMCQGVPVVEMADILNVHRGTIYLDVKHWKERLGSHVATIREDPEAANTEIGLTIRKLDSVVEAAFQEYSMAKSGSEKDKFLNTACKALSTKTRILQESGVLPKAGVEIKAKIEHDMTFAQRFGDASPLKTLDDPASRHKVLEMATRLLKMAETPPIEGELVDIKQLPEVDEAR